MMEVKFNLPPHIGNEEKFVLEALKNEKLSGDSYFMNKCHQWFEDKFKTSKVLMTTSCSTALDMTAILLNLEEGDEVIMPSYTFSSTANAYAIRKAKIIFVDIEPKTMNVNPYKIEAAINSKTKAIVIMHYAGISCDMDHIMQIANKHNLYVIEDAAQGMMSAYKKKPLGTIGDFGTFSFHDTKNYTSGGEGGLLILNNKKFYERAEIIREKGTNRRSFFRGQVDKYSWMDIGSSFLPCELQAACLWAQLQNAEKINQFRLKRWHQYNDSLKVLEELGLVDLPYVPEGCEHNAHMYYLKLKNLEERSKLIHSLRQKNISSAFHYIPLHSAPAGKKCGSFFGEDKHTTSHSERLLRLPMYYGISAEKVEYVINSVLSFFKQKKL